MEKELPQNSRTVVNPRIQRAIMEHELYAPKPPRTRKAWLAIVNRLVEKGNSVSRSVRTANDQLNVNYSETVFRYWKGKRRI